MPSARLTSTSTFSGAILLAAALSIGLAGCTPAAEPEPSESASASASAPPSPSASPSPSVAALVLPGTCEELVALAQVRAIFGDALEAIDYGPGGGGPDAIEFNARGGLVCFWGIPQTEAGISLMIAERETATDAEQIAAWQAAGYQLGPDFLDALYYEVGPTEVGDFVQSYSLVSGYEIRAGGYGTDLDPYLSLVRHATDSMGYL